MGGHFRGKGPEVRALFDAVVAALRAMSFAQVTPRQKWLDGHVVLARRVEQPRFRQVQTVSPRNHLHAFRLTSLDQVDGEFRDWLREAYQVGEQRHLDRPAEAG